MFTSAERSCRWVLEGFAKCDGQNKRGLVVLGTLEPGGECREDDQSGRATFVPGRN